ncbi:transposase [Prevotella histicola]
MITKLRKKMKKYLFLLQDRIMLRKRSTVETMNNNLRIYVI